MTVPVPVEFTSPVMAELSWAVAPIAIEPADSVVAIVGDVLFTISCSLFVAVHGLVAPLLLASPL